MYFPNKQIRKALKGMKQPRFVLKYNLFHDVEIIECKISSQTLNSGFLGGELLAVLTVELTS